MQQLTLNEYQEKAMTTCLPTCNNIAYMSMNLCGEVGELLSKLAKAIRKGKLFIGTSDRDENGERIMTQTLHGVTEQEMNDIKKECGDIKGFDLAINYSIYHKKCYCLKINGCLHRRQSNRAAGAIAIFQGSDGTHLQD